MSGLHRRLSTMPRPVATARGITFTATVPNLAIGRQSGHCAITDSTRARTPWLALASVDQGSAGRAQPAACHGPLGGKELTDHARPPLDRRSGAQDLSRDRHAGVAARSIAWRSALAAPVVSVARSARTAARRSVSIC
jgi:hypothetical protein